MATNYENLTVYQIACRLADGVWAEVARWPRLTLGKQLVRSADSIGANIAEGSGRGSQADFRRFLYIARGSLYETTHWLRAAERRSITSPGTQADMNALTSRLLPMLNALLRSTAESRAVHEPAAVYGDEDPTSTAPLSAVLTNDQRPTIND